MSAFLTFDLGTTYYKVALFDDEGNLLALRRIVSPGEMDPNGFRRVLFDAAHEIRHEVGQRWNDVAAVSFATQANTFTLLDARERPLVPFIVWTDARARGLEREIPEQDFTEITGLPRPTALIALTKLLWLKRNAPELMSKAHRLVFLSDELTRWFTGRYATEASSAGLSGLMDIRACAWREDAGIQLPEIVRAGTELGAIDSRTADELELPRTCRFVVGCLDQYAGAIGTGVAGPGAVCETTGTALSVVRCTELIDSSRREVVHSPASKTGLWFAMSFSSTSANLLELYRSALPGNPSYEELSRRAEDRDDPAGKVVRGIMRCVGHALGQQLRSLCGDELPASIRCAGGAARSDTWLQIKADEVGISMEVTSCQEPASLGAAMLAASATGAGELSEIAKRWVRVRKTFRPSLRAR